KRMALTMLLFPVPLFPTIPVIPSWKMISWSRNLLKFLIQSLWSSTLSLSVTCDDLPEDRGPDLLHILFLSRGEVLSLHETLKLGDVIQADKRLLPEDLGCVVDGYHP